MRARTRIQCYFRKICAYKLQKEHALDHLCLRIARMAGEHNVLSVDADMEFKLINHNNAADTITNQVFLSKC